MQPHDQIVTLHGAPVVIKYLTVLDDRDCKIHGADDKQNY